MMEVRKRRRVGSKKSTVLNGSSQSSDSSGSTHSSVWCYAATAFVVFIQTVLLIFIFSPSLIRPEIFSPMEPPQFQGALAFNDDLETMTARMFGDKFIGPESLVTSGDSLCTGTYDHGVIRIDLQSNEVHEFPSLGDGICGNPSLEKTCGRPLGLRIREQNLYVIDAYFGLFKYDLANISAPAVQLFEDVVFGNDIAIASSGLIYYTDSSRRWERRNFMHLIFEATSDGIVREFNESSMEHRTLSTTLSFANGIEISPQEDYLVVCETSRARISRYWLKGPSRGSWDFFAHNLPGLPDNIRLSPRGTYWVGFAAVRTGSYSQLYEYGNSPFLRNLALKLLTWMPSLLDLIPSAGMIVELDTNGSIIRSLQDVTGNTVPSVSEVEEVGSVLYLGSYSHPYLTKLTFH